jgi:hypothetical protein
MRLQNIAAARGQSKPHACQNRHEYFDRKREYFAA